MVFLRLGLATSDLKSQRKVTMSLPSKEDLEKTLADAGAAHHEYEQATLGGKRDEQWSGFYAAYALGRVGDFASPSALSRWLEEAPGGEQWAASAASYVLSRLGDQ
jgi:hypothetical protein